MDKLMNMMLYTFGMVMFLGYLALLLPDQVKVLPAMAGVFCYLVSFICFMALVLSARVNALRRDV